MKLIAWFALLLTLSCTVAALPATSPPATDRVTATFGALPITNAPTATPTQADASTAIPTDAADVTATATATATPSPPPSATENPYPWTDELLTMYGICFEAALDASGEVYVLRTAEEHIRFYDLADNSGLCRLPVEREPFDFAGGARVLAGTWNTGTGCTARHDVQSYSVEDGVLRIELRFITEGDCNYELVRPYWVGAEDVDDVQITVLGEEADE